MDLLVVLPHLLLLQRLDYAHHVFGRRRRLQLKLPELHVYLGVVIEQLCLKRRDSYFLTWCPTMNMPKAYAKGI